ncbi:MAG: SusD/RagB family nutrient-binding outer membrane lipoprotein [Cyclobacteriaceae bacterium]|nr:SusD/RagB family nutrient-binding outer membrane lipoprotein [Cyclobacteriaceae bacterium]
MKKIFIYMTLTISILISYSCQDFSEIGLNENRPASVPPSLVLRGVLSDLSERPWSLEHRQNQFWSCNYNYYGTNEYWTNASLSYLTLKNVIKMEEEAAKSGSQINPYTALGKYFRAVFYTRMTQQVGDIPLSEALQGLEIKEPIYDTQKEVYVQILAWLDQSNSELKQLIAANDLSLTGDFYYGNNLTKWRKAVNTFKLRVLISLSKHDTDSDLNIKSKFNEVISNPTEFPIMTSIDDNMNYVFNGTTQIYPTNPSNRGFDKGRYNMTETYIKGLTDRNDPRVFVIANPAKAKITGGTPANDFSAFVGAPAGESLDDMTVKAGNGVYSFANQKRYYTSLAGPEPGVQLAYWELCFNVAEAINRSWISGDAKAYYENGIKASMTFYGIAEGTQIPIYESDNDIQIGTATASLTNYLAQGSVAYAGTNSTGLTQILTQKYLAFFQNSGQEAYFNYRRTGVPAFHSGVGTGNSGVIPKRWLYPTSETFYNDANLKTALMRQFGSEVDDVDNVLWINK